MVSADLLCQGPVGGRAGDRRDLGTCQCGQLDDNVTDPTNPEHPNLLTRRHGRLANGAEGRDARAQ